MDDRQFDARVRMAMEAGGIGVWEWDVADDRVTWSDEVLRMYGVDRSEFRGTYADAIDRVCAEDRPRLERIVQAAVGSAGAFEVEYRVGPADGEHRWLSCVGRAFEGTSGGTSHLTGIVFDVTDRRRAEEELLRTNRLLEGAQRIAHMGSFEWRRTSDQVSSTAETYRILGLDPCDTFAAPLEAYLERVHPDDREAVARCFETQAEGSFTIDHRIVRANDGQVRDVRLEGRLEMDVDGRPGHGFGALVDMTEELARERAEKELEQRLMRSRKFEALGQLAGGIAHDFNNLLTAILGNVTLVRRRTGGEDAGRSSEDWVEVGLGQIEEAARRAVDLTRQLLAFGSRGTGRADPVDVNAHLASMSDMLRRLIGEHLHLEMELSDTPTVVRIDTSQLEQVVMNLAINARDAMPEGGLLSIATERVTGERGEPARVVLRVQDTGAGMAPEVLERIFEPFFTTKEMGKGTGLGLATVYGIVQQVGGRCDVRSQPGRGTIFEVSLPAAEQPAKAAHARSAARSAGGSEQLLVCEDDPQVLEVTSGILSSSGYRVFVAADGDEALRVLDERRGAIDLVVTDVVMPHLGGRELAARLADRGLRTPFVFVSGYVPDDPERGDAPLPGPLLSKPFSADELLDTVRRVLDERHADGESLADATP